MPSTPGPAPRSSSDAAPSTAAPSNPAPAAGAPSAEVAPGDGDESGDGGESGEGGGRSGELPGGCGVGALAHRARWPAVALVVLVLCGGWFESAVGVYAAVGHLTVLALGLAGAFAWRDPLALGRRGRWLLAGLVVTVLASCWASPVSRAGWTVVALLPAWLLVPAGIARLWQEWWRPGAEGEADDPDDAHGLVPAAPPGRASVAWIVLWVAAVALLQVVRGVAPRASAYLDHHNLTAVWLVALLPVALQSLALPPWRRRGGGARVVAGAAGVLGLVALATTRSLSGALGLATALAVGWVLRRRLADGRLPSAAGGNRSWSLGRKVLAGVVLAAPLAAMLPRLLRVLAGTDASLLVRRTYWAAALDGFGERPLLGWGPGSTAWTLAEWLRPVPGVNPPQELVGDLHSLPLTVAYELGTTGLLLAAVVLGLFLWRRWRELPRARDPVLSAAGTAGVAGGAVAMLAVSPLAVPAVVLALAVAAAAALAGGAAPGAEPPPRSWRRHWPALLWIAAAVVCLGRLDLAHVSYDRSISDASFADRHHVERPASVAPGFSRAVRLDPRFPLYRLQWAHAVLGRGPSQRLTRPPDPRLADAAAEALTAAEDAVAVPTLWLVTGDLALSAGEPWAGIALERACRLDPLGQMAPFLLAVGAHEGGDDAAAAVSLARAFLAEPRLAAATWFVGREELRAAAVDEVRRWPGVGAGWRVAFADAVGRIEGTPGGSETRLRLVAGPDPLTSVAFFAFHRAAVGLELAAVPVHRDWAEALDLPAAAALPETSADAFGTRGCAPSEVAFAAP